MIVPFFFKSNIRLILYHIVTDMSTINFTKPKTYFRAGIVPALDRSLSMNCSRSLCHQSVIANLALNLAE